MLLLALGGTLTACGGLPDEGPTDIARLSVGAVEAVSALVDADSECGFASAEVLQNAQISGDVGTMGSITWRVNRCRIHPGDTPQVAHETCTGEKTTVTGQVLIVASKTTEGILTGDPEHPILPAGENATTLTIESAEFRQFEVKSTQDKHRIVLVDGSLSAGFRPRLAQNDDNGACTVKTPVAEVFQLSYAPSDVGIRGDDTYDVRIQSSNIKAVRGDWQSKENFLDGTLRIDDDDYSVPEKGSTLDPGYSHSDFDAGMACLEGARSPLAYSCDPNRIIGAQAGRESVALLDALVQLLEADETCGFPSIDAVASVKTLGELGQRGGSAEWDVVDCELNLGALAEVARDCGGARLFAGGNVTVTATKSVVGWLTGSLRTPVLPDGEGNLRYVLSATFDDFELAHERDVVAVRAVSGTLSGEFKPRLAYNTATGACDTPSARVQVEHAAWENGSLRLFPGEMTLNAAVSGSDMSAIRGRIGDYENRLGGSISVNGSDVALGPDTGPLSPGYDAETFNAGDLSCNPHLGVPANESTCTFEETLAGHTARRMLSAAALLTRVSRANDQCGFASVHDQLPDSLLGTAPGSVETGSWSVSECLLPGGDAGPSVVHSSCDGGMLALMGTATVSGTETMTGAYTSSESPVLVPVTPGDVRVDLGGVALSDFSMLHQALGGDQARPLLAIADATLSGAVLPITGESATAPGRYPIATDVVAFVSIRTTPAAMTVYVADMQFDVNVSSANLSGLRGSYDGASNHIQGHLAALGQEWTFSDLPFDPAFDQSTFDAGYTCAEDLAGPVSGGL